jgi:rare lipoprotein A (peptidoglycan hydrolase)
MCASPTLPFGTVLTVTNDVTGASTTCTVDDREAAGYPRVVDMSYSGFSQLADPSQGVVDVTISW